MRLQRFAVVLTAVNLVLLSLAFTQVAPQTVSPVLRGRALELVDGNGKLRSRLSVEADGEVVLRLLDKNGTIRVSEDGLGLLLVDEATEPGIHLIARRAGTPSRPATTSLTLRVDGQTRIIRP
jgi:hypothetical protein